MKPRTVAILRQIGGAMIVLAIAIGALQKCAEDRATTPVVSEQTKPTPAPAESPASRKEATAPKLPHSKDFDYYVLSLSWSPSYCEAEGADANRQQCASGRPYAFVVHGLWPQFERGWPEDCQTRDREVADGTLRSLYDIMPSAGLIRYQWRKHGSCSGFGQGDYFRVLRAARERIVIPAAYRQVGQWLTVDPDTVESDFRKANQGLPANGVAVTCDDRYLREVRLCLTQDLAFRSCPEVDRRACTSAKAVMPPMRGG